MPSIEYQRIDQHEHKPEPTPPTASPWGRVDERAKIAPGVWRVHTSRHGGIWLEERLRAMVPAALVAGNFLHSVEWWEEDSDALTVELYFDLIPDKELERCRRIKSIDGKPSTLRELGIEPDAGNWHLRGNG